MDLFHILILAAVILSVKGLLERRRIVRRFVTAAASLATGISAGAVSHRPALLVIDTVLLALRLVGVRIDVGLRAGLRRPAVIDYLDARPEGAYGPDIAATVHLGSGLLYPLLARLERDGAIRSWWDPEPVDGQPRRRLYGLAVLPVTTGTEA